MPTINTFWPFDQQQTVTTGVWYPENTWMTRHFFIEGEYKEGCDAYNWLTHEEEVSEDKFADMMDRANSHHARVRTLRGIFARNGF